jgi:membrane-associated phospholipid phosphatase
VRESDRATFQALAQPRVWGWLLGGWVLATAVGMGFGLYLQASGDWTSGFAWERELMLSLPRPLPRALDAAMLFLPWLGTNLTLIPFFVLTGAWLWIRRERGFLALHFLLVQLGTLIMNSLVKGYFDRPRPELWQWRGQFAWASYPSGHAIVSTSVIFTIAILLHRERGWRWPFAAASLLLVVSLFSRMYLGVHWPTDVIGGLLMGIVWLAVTLIAFDPRNARRELPERETTIL